MSEPDQHRGSTYEAIYNVETRTWVTGDQLAYQGCDSPGLMCSRIGDRCVGWHCVICHAPTSSQGHDCPERPA